MMYLFVTLLAVFTILSGAATVTAVLGAIDETHFLSKTHLFSVARRCLLVFVLFLISFILTLESLPS